MTCAAARGARCAAPARTAARASHRRAALAIAACTAALAVGACSARRPAPPGPGVVSCESTAGRDPAAAICSRDEGIRSVRARFRSSVTTSSGTREAEGVLVLRRPDALRIKLFTLGGLTVYDATWVGDGGAVRGRVSLPLEGRTRDVRSAPGEPVADPEVGLSLALWALWQPRCAAPPRAAAPGRDAGAPGRFVLDPAPAQALLREVTVADGDVREEVLVRAGAPGASEDRVVASYADIDCSLAVPLPRRISLSAPAQGWRAEVRILEMVQNLVLDDALFDVPGASAPGERSGRAGC